MIDDLILKPGERGIIIGQTGSGKTRGAIWQLQMSELYPIIIFDTKGEPAFLELPLYEEETIEVIDGLQNFAKKWRDNAWPDYTIVRPTALEMSEPLGAMDEALNLICENPIPGLFYFDEMYQWHDNGKAGAGLIGMLTRGRSKGLTTLMSTQRPSWLSRFCFTESQRFYFYKLLDKRDQKILANFVPGAEELDFAQKFSWYYADNDAYGGGVSLKNPVPLLKKVLNDAEKDLRKIKFI